MKFTLEITQTDKVHALITDEDGAHLQIQTEPLTGDKYRDRAALGNFYHNLVEAIGRRIHPDLFPKYKIETMPDGTTRATIP